MFHEGDRGGLRNRLLRSGRRQVTRLVVDTEDDDVVSGLIGGEQIGVGRIDRDVSAASCRGSAHARPASASRSSHRWRRPRCCRGRGWSRRGTGRPRRSESRRSSCCPCSRRAASMSTAISFRLPPLTSNTLTAESVSWFTYRNLPFGCSWSRRGPEPAFRLTYGGSNGRHRPLGSYRDDRCRRDPVRARRRTRSGCPC